MRGVLQAVPPDSPLADGIKAGVPVLNAVVGATKVAKIRAVAVAEDARGNGIGQTLIRRAVRTYLQIGFLLIYGQFPVGSGLASARIPRIRNDCSSVGVDGRPDRETPSLREAHASWKRSRRVATTRP